MNNHRPAAQIEQAAPVKKASFQASWPDNQATIGMPIRPPTLAHVERRATGLNIGLVHEYSREPLAIESGMLVAELGSAPNDGLYQQLRERSANRGRTDPWALKTWTAQPAFDTGKAGGAPGAFLLYAIGDAVASRDIHAAMLDALRILKDC